MGAHDGHRERLRARFLREGLAGFPEHNVLELLLFFAQPRRDMNEVAHRLIEHFGSFAAVLDAPMEELMRVKGVGAQSATLLKMIPELGAYYLDSRSDVGNVLDTTEKAGAFFLPKFFGRSEEMLYIVSLDDKRKVIRCTCLADKGIVNAVAISVKHVVSEAVRTNATGILIAHNHPGGLALPSYNDREMTRRVLQALRMISVSLLDHIVVADDDFVSMADSGFIEQMQASM